MPNLSRRRSKEIASLAHKKYRDRLGQTLVEGLRSVTAAVDAGAPLVELLVADAVRDAPAVQALAARAEVPVYVLPAADLSRLSEVQTTKGVLAVVRTPLAPDETLPGARTILALDGVQDPGNAGTLMRTAAWFGVDVLLAGPGTVDLFNPKVVRAAMGGLWDLQLAQTADLAATLQRLRRQGFTCYGADLQGTDARRWQPRRPSVLVLGSEAHGLSDTVAAELDEAVRIPGTPQRAGTESLNVAIAAGILLYEWMGG